MMRFVGGADPRLTYHGLRIRRLAFAGFAGMQDCRLGKLAMVARPRRSPYKAAAYWPRVARPRDSRPGR